MGNIKMPEFKLNINDPKTGKSYSKVFDTETLENKKIKDKIQGNPFGLDGYELEITGGSDKSGFPMRHDLNISGRKKILLSKGPGVKIKRKGLRTRKTVMGNIITNTIKQINLKITTHGTKKIEDIFEAQKEEKGDSGEVQS
jgi:small subunit ribosomal protein S6e